LEAVAVRLATVPTPGGVLVEVLASSRGWDPPSRYGCPQSVDLMALMLEQVGHDLLKRPLPVAELHLAGGRHDVELLVG
jgi:hypothetical protein